MFTQLKALVARRRARQEALALSPHDLDDLGMTQAELLEFIDLPQDVPDRLAAMADLLGVRQVRRQAPTLDYRDMLRNCGACRDRAHCARVLAQGAAARDEAIGFCLNAMACLSLAEAGQVRAAA